MYQRKCFQHVPASMYVWLCVCVCFFVSMHGHIYVPYTKNKRRLIIVCMPQLVIFVPYNIFYSSYTVAKTSIGAKSVTSIVTNWEFWKVDITWAFIHIRPLQMNFLFCILRWFFMSPGGGPFLDFVPWQSFNYSSCSRKLTLKCCIHMLDRQRNTLQLILPRLGWRGRWTGNRKFIWSGLTSSSDAVVYSSTTSK